MVGTVHVSQADSIDTRKHTKYFCVISRGPRSIAWLTAHVRLSQLEVGRHGRDEQFADTFTDDRQCARQNAASSKLQLWATRSTQAPSCHRRNVSVADMQTLTAPKFRKSDHLRKGTSNGPASFSPHSSVEQLILSDWACEVELMRLGMAAEVRGLRVEGSRVWRQTPDRHKNFGGEVTAPQVSAEVIVFPVLHIDGRG